MKETELEKLLKKYNNTVIRATSDEHIEKVLKWWSSKGINTGNVGYFGGIIGSFYGVIDNIFVCEKYIPESTKIIELTEEIPVLPEKWCVKITPENINVIGEFYNKQLNTCIYSNYYEEYTYVSSHHQYKGFSIMEGGEGNNFLLSKLTSIYPEITFKQFKKHVLKEKEFKLPEKWYCAYSNREEFDTMRKFFNVVWSYVIPNGEFGCTNNKDKNHWHSKEITGYTKITFEQFKRHVMKEKRIIGYKLKQEYSKYEKTVLAIIGEDVFTDNDCNFKVNSVSAEICKKVEILDLWFDPVYEKVYSLPTINGYEGEILWSNMVKYGCTEFDIHHLQEILNLVQVSRNRKIESITLDSGVSITVKQLEQIIEYFDNEI